jgi:hypothetical protein
MTKSATLLFLTSGFGDNLLALPLALELEEKTHLTCITLQGPQSEFFAQCLPNARHLVYDRSRSGLLPLLKAGIQDVTWVYPIGACARGLRLLHLAAIFRTAIGFTSLVARKAWQAEIGLDVCLLPNLAQPAWRNNLRLLQLLNLGTSRTWEDYTAILNSRLPTEKRIPDRLLIHPGSAHYAGRLERFKRWPLERFKAIADSLISDHQFKEVCWVLGPEDMELEEPLRKLFSDAPEHRLISYKEFGGNLLSMGRFLSSAGQALTNDTGLSHLATLYNVPLTSILSGIGQPSYTGQSGTNTQLVIQKTPCQGCCVGISNEEAERFECHYDWACMNLITTERVLDVIRGRKSGQKFLHEVL